MKLPVFFSLVAVVTVGLSSFAVAEDSLIPNGDMEGNGGWSTGKGVSLEDDGGNHYLRLTAENPGQQVMAYKKIELPSGVKALNVSFRARATDLAPGAQSWHTGRVVMHFKDDAGTMLKPDPKPYAFKGTTDWETKTVRLEVPEGATSLEFLPALFQVAGGTLDIDDVVITPEAN